MADYESETASSGEPFKVGIMATEDGDKVVLVLRAGQEDQAIYWLDTSADALSPYAGARHRETIPSFVRYDP